MINPGSNSFPERSSGTTCWGWRVQILLLILAVLLLGGYNLECPVNGHRLAAAIDQVGRIEQRHDGYLIQRPGGKVGVNIDRRRLGRNETPDSMKVRKKTPTGC